MIRKLLAATALFAATALHAAEPDGLILPPGFQAEVVASDLTGARHLAVRANGDIFVSTRSADPGADAIIALRLDTQHHAIQTLRFGSVRNGSGIAFHDGALYASTPTEVWRFDKWSDSLVPPQPPTLILSGLPKTGFLNRILVFDNDGALFVGVGGSGNICAPKPAPGAKPVGQSPCRDLTGRSGIWRFDPARTGQHFPQDGTQVATGIRDLDALAWRKGDGLYAVMHGRNGIAEAWPTLASRADDDAIAEEMHRITPGTNLGWPYTYYDGARRIRLSGPEYGGDGKTPAPTGYSLPVATFTGHSAPLDIVFYEGKTFPREYRHGAFIAFHGSSAPAIPTGHPGFNITFLPFAHGKPGQPRIFADGFAGAEPASRNAATATYRPTGVAVAPDGALYVVDGTKGRLWRISYSGGVR